MSKIIIYACLIISFSAYANTIYIKDIQHTIDEVEEESKQLVGGAFAIIQNNQIIYKKSFGRKEVNGSPVDDNSLFGLASVSKAITATALAVLSEKNIIYFEDEVSINGVNLPLKNILSHTTGYKIRGDNQIEKGVTRQTLLNLLTKKSWARSKTTKPYFYSNLVYSLAQDYAQSKGYKLDNLIKTLNISSYTLPIDSKNLASPHSKNKEKIAFPSNYQKIVPAAAGIFSSLNGMIEFLHVVLGNRPYIISKKSLNILFTPIAKADDIFYWNILPFKNEEVVSLYCLGWRKLALKSSNKSTLIFHSGSINGATAFVGIIPELRVGITIFTNQSSNFALKNGLNIWKTMIEKYKL